MARAVTPSPLRRKKTGPDARQDCDCCEADCGCTDCERCSDAAVEVSSDWIPPPAMGAAGAKAGKGGKPKGRKGAK